jgi:hypothetical protein
MQHIKLTHKTEVMIMQDLYLYGVFGLPTWTLVDGTWAVLSQLADTLPEGYNISAYLILALTFGNIVPLIIGFTVRDTTSILNYLIYGILTVGLTTGVTMAFVWNQTVSFGSSQVSLPLLIMFFVVGACSSSSNVTHYTFVSKSPAQNTTALATGMGLGSMTAGILALLQGLLLVDYGFSVTAYYLVLALLYIPALLAFMHLLERNKYQNEDASNTADRGSFGRESSLQLSQKAVPDNILLVDSESGGSTENTEYSEAAFLEENRAILALQMLNASLGFGFIPALVSFACGRFENAFLILQLATGITAVIDPLLKFATYYIRLESFASLRAATAVLCLLAVGLVLCATLPGDLSLYRGAGGVLPVLLYVSFMGLFGFTNTSIFRYFKCAINPRFVHHSYRWSGICCQSGALLGSLIAFTVIVTGVL